MQKSGATDSGSHVEETQNQERNTSWPAQTQFIHHLFRPFHPPRACKALPSLGMSSQKCWQGLSLATPRRVNERKLLEGCRLKRYQCLHLQRLNAVLRERPWCYFSFLSSDYALIAFVISAIPSFHVIPSRDEDLHRRGHEFVSAVPI